MLQLITESLPLWLMVLTGFLLAFLITGKSIPSIVRVAQLKGLCDTPNERTSHKLDTPTLGGIGIFAGFVISTILVGSTFFKGELGYIIVGLVVIFFTGIKDDILIIDPKKKLAAQVLVALFISVMAGIRLDSFYGLFNLQEMPYLVSIALTVFIVIVIDNGFNLIDGIDGLSSGVGIIASVTFGALLWWIGDPAYAVMGFAFAGSLIAFFGFNVFSKPNKIFLGDTGSLIVGLVISILTIRFLQQNQIAEQQFYFEAAPALSVGILIIPLFDTLRVFTLRIIQKKSPFTADRQHIHHRVLQLGCNHRQASLIILIANILFIGMSLLLLSIGIIWQIAILFSVASLACGVLMHFVNKKQNNSLSTRYVSAKTFNVYYQEIRQRKRKNEVKSKVLQMEDTVI